jgi:hypothetical protein
MARLALLAVPFLLISLTLGGCRYYGSAVPPENPISMGSAMQAASNQRTGPGGAQKGVVRVPTRPNIERPSYLPEKELALVAPPQTLLVWTYPHVTDDNTREFGNWKTIFLTERYEWARPANQLPQGADDAGVTAGRPNLGQPQLAPGVTTPASTVPAGPVAQ